jgi:hypothetical protein
VKSYPNQNIPHKKARYSITNTTPCHLCRVLLLSINKTAKKSIWTIRLIRISRLLALLKAIGLTIAVIPKTKKTLNILDQTMFPTAIFALDFVTATIDVASSGNDVPIARIVSPISFSLRHRMVASIVALFTTIFPHRASPAIHPITMSVDCREGRGFIISSCVSSGRDLTISTV